MAVEVGDVTPGGRARGARRQIVTPEGVALSVDLADLGDRLGALLLDLLLVVGVGIVLTIISLLFAAAFRTSAGLAPIVLFFFLGTSAYFLIAELHGQGATLGKRWMGLRVIDRRGAALTSQAIIARNLMRSFEIFLPIGMLLAAAVGGWGSLALAAWFLLFALMPVFNRDRQRCGDMIAGTLVIVLPKPVLGVELVVASTRFTFTTAQLDAYGERELQVLEDLLRRRAELVEAARRKSRISSDFQQNEQLLLDVGPRIRNRIGWAGAVSPGDEETFLREFYGAQRAYLEHKAVITGRRRRSKADGRWRAGGA